MNHQHLKDKFLIIISQLEVTVEEDHLLSRIGGKVKVSEDMMDLGQKATNNKTNRMPRKVTAKYLWGHYLTILRLQR